MNEIYLTQKEAEKLLNMLKVSMCDELILQNKRGMKEIEVKGQDTEDVFKISIYRGNISKNKANYGARIKKNNIMLLELHINPTNTHINPDNKKIIGSHWHIYKEKYEMRYAFEAKDIEDDDFVDNTLYFLRKFNVIKLPNIQCQAMIEM